MKPIKVINVPDVSPGDAFVDLSSIGNRSVTWVGHSGLPANALEQYVRRPRLSRYRAAWSAISEAQQADIVISHLPRMTQAVELAARIRRRRLPHLAFSFNFTDIPEGCDLVRMRRSFALVEQFCVYSKYEATLYPELFGIAASRFHSLMWSQSTPTVDLSTTVPDMPFVMAIGGEGRDLKSIIAAARIRPDLHWLVVTRPNPVFDAAPDNLSVRFNVPAPATWGMAARAAAVIVPLRSDDTCCGHITIASAQLLGLPLITTRSHATREYVEGMPATTVIEPNDPHALAAAAERAIADRIPIQLAAMSTRDIAAIRYDRTAWVKSITTFIGRHAHQV